MDKIAVDHQIGLFSRFAVPEPRAMLMSKDKQSRLASRYKPILVLIRVPARDLEPLLNYN